MNIYHKKEALSIKKKPKKKISLKDTPTKKTTVKPYVTKDGSIVKSHNRDQHIGSPDDPTSVKFINSKELQDKLSTAKEGENGPFFESVDGMLSAFKEDVKNGLSKKNIDKFFEGYNKNIIEKHGNNDARTSYAASKLVESIVRTDLKNISNPFRKIDGISSKQAAGMAHGTDNSLFTYKESLRNTDIASNMSSSLLNKIGKDTTPAELVAILPLTEFVKHDSAQGFNDNLNEALGRKTDNGKDLNFLTKTINSIPELRNNPKISHNIDMAVNTLIDHHANTIPLTKELQSNPTAQTAMDKYFDGEYRDFSADEIKKQIGTSQNPNELYSLANEQIVNGKKRDRFKINETNIVNDQYASSGSRYGQLMRRGINHTMNKSQSNKYLEPDKYESGSYFRSTDLGADKLPDDFKTSMQNIHNKTKQFLKDNPDFFSKVSDVDGTLFRGYNIPPTNRNTTKGIQIEGGLFSTSVRASNASKFAHGIDPVSKEHAHDLIYEPEDAARGNEDVVSSSLQDYKQMFADDGLAIGVSSDKKKYLQDSVIYSKSNTLLFTTGGKYASSSNKPNLGLMLTFDQEKLQKDNNIFMILTDEGLSDMKKTQPKIKFQGGEGEVVIHT